MAFEGNGFMMTERGIFVEEKDYPALIRDIIEHIADVKSKDASKDNNITDIILDYAFRNNIDTAAIGDIISSDGYLKSFIEKDYESCQKKTDEW